MPEQIGEGLGAYYIKKCFNPLSLNKDGICEVCQHLIKKHNKVWIIKSNIWLSDFLLNATVFVFTLLNMLILNLLPWDRSYRKLHCITIVLLAVSMIIELILFLNNILTEMSETTIKKRYKYCIKRYRHLSERML